MATRKEKSQKTDSVTNFVKTTQDIQEVEREDLNPRPTKIMKSERAPKLFSPLPPRLTTFDQTHQDDFPLTEG
jgi:hypothetical protein